MSKHTPGPWEFTPVTNDSRRVLSKDINEHGNWHVALVFPSDADAHLIAAAPDLLEALTRLTEKVERANSIQHSGGTILPEDWSELYTLQNEARAAIAKAQGKE